MASTEEKKKSPEVTKTRKPLRERPSVAKRSPEDETYKMFKNLFSANSPVIKTFQNQGLITAVKDNSEILKKQSDLFHHNIIIGKQLTTALIKNSNRLDFIAQVFDKNTKEQRGKKDDKFENVLKSSAQTTKNLNKNVLDVFKFLKQTEQKKQQREIESEVEEFKSKLAAKTKTDKDEEKARKEKEGGWISKPTYQQSQLEKKTTALVGKGFHFTTGMVSEYLQKKGVKNKALEREQNLPEDEQSEEHKSYLRTKKQWRVFKNRTAETYQDTKDNIKDAAKVIKNKASDFNGSVPENIGGKVASSAKDKIDSFLNKFKKKKTEIENTEIRPLQPQPRDSSGRFTKNWDEPILPKRNDKGQFVKTENTEKVIQEGDTKIVSSVDKVHSVLQKIAGYFADKAEADKDSEDENAEKVQPRDSLGRFTKKVDDTKIDKTGSGETSLGGLGSLLSKGKSLLGKFGKIGAGSAEAAEGGVAAEAGGAGLAGLALPATAVLASGAAGYGAGTLINKKLWKKTDAQEKESSDNLAEQTSDMQKNNPKAYQLTQIQKKVRGLQSLKQTPEVEANIKQLQSQYSDILDQNAGVSKASANPVIEKASNDVKASSGKVPATDTSKASPVTPVLDSKILLKELSEGSIVKVLQDILEGIGNLAPSNTHKVGMLGMPSEGSSMSKSGIYNLRESMRA